MPDFLPLPEGVDISVGSENEETARVNTAQFGNGYAQRSGDGLNNITSELTVNFDNLTRAEANTLIDFFRSCGGWRAFLYRLPGEDVDKLWTCDKWRKRYVEATIDGVSAVFKEVFNP